MRRLSQSSGIVECALRTQGWRGLPSLLKIQGVLAHRMQVWGGLPGLFILQGVVLRG